MATLPPILDPDARRRLGELRAALDRRDAEGLRDLSGRLVHRRGPAVLSALMASIDDREALAFWNGCLLHRPEPAVPVPVQVPPQVQVPAPAPVPMTAPVSAEPPQSRRRAQVLRRWLPSEWQLPAHDQAA